MNLLAVVLPTAQDAVALSSHHLVHNLFTYTLQLFIDAVEHLHCQIVRLSGSLGGDYK